MLDKYKNSAKYSLSFSALIKNPVHFCAFGFGSGLINPAPGTWGTLFAVVLLLAFWPYLLINKMLAIIFLLLSFLLGIYFCEKTSKDIQIHDFSGIVWDEFVGVWLLMLFMPKDLFFRLPIWVSALICFALFRIFDILKPPPIRQIDSRITGGFGIMLDDVLAAAFALAILWLCKIIVV